MSNETTDQATAETVSVETAVPSTKRVRRKVNLAAAHTADGEVRSATSVYDVMGISTHGYQTTSLARYTADVKSMNLMQLQDEAYKRAVLPTDSREALIDRLEKKFITETSKFKATADSRNHVKTADQPDSIKDQALRVLSRGR